MADVEGAVMADKLIEPVYAVITGYVTYPGPSGPVNSALPGPCGTHRYFATVQTDEGIMEEYQIWGSAAQCYEPPTLHVVPLPIGRAVHGVRIRNGANQFRYQWDYRELPLVAPCNTGGG